MVRVSTADVSAPDAGDWCETHAKTIDTENAVANLSRAKLAEVAAADWLNGVRNADTDTDGDDGGYDVRLPNGDTVDVKSTHYTDGHLLIPNYVVSNLRADYYLLVITPKDADHVEIVGYATPDEIMDKPTCDWNKNPCKAFKQRELTDPNDLQANDGGRAEAIVAEANERL